MTRQPLYRFTASILASVLIVAACGDDGSDVVPAATAAPATTAAPVTTSAPASTTTGPVSTTAAAGIVNTWKASTVDATKLPIGDKSVSTSGAAVGTLYSCSAGNPNAGGATKDGPWIDAAAGTWNSQTKLAVQGEVAWPTAKYSEVVEGANRVITTNGLPVQTVTGTFPIATSDPSYQYDRNPGRVGESAKTFTLPANPTAAAKPSCLAFDAVGVLKNGVVMFNALDGRGQDAVAHESQDVCNGHPAQTTYHYHSIPSCLVKLATGASTVVGYALDGFPIVVERDASGKLPSNADLDECHGRSSPILLDGKVTTTYHYSATLEFPYTIGCYKGTPVANPR